MGVTITIHDEINARITGLPPSIMGSLVREYSVYAKAFRFHQKYKMGVWDGKIRFLSNNGKTTIHILDKVLDSMAALGVDMSDVKINDNRPPLPDELTHIEPVKDDLFSEYSLDGEKPVILYEYQTAAVNACIERGHGIVEIGTGGGKTLFITTLAKIYSQFGKVVVIVPNIDLVIQTVEGTMRKCNIDAGMWYGEVKSDKPIIVATWQSLNNARELLDGAVMVLVDEAHTAGASVISELLLDAGRNVPFRFGCTGSLPLHKVERLRIEMHFGDVIFKKSSFDLRKDGFLSTVEIEQFNFRDRLYENPNPDEELNWVDVVHFYHRIPARQDKIADIIASARTKHGNTLVLIPYLDMVDDYHKRFPDAVVVTGKIPSSKRSQIFKDFNVGDGGLMLATYGVASTGIDIPRIFAVVMIEPGKSFQRVVQTIGRGLRKSSDKNHVYVADIASGGTAKKHATERRSFYKNQRIPFKKIVVEYDQ